MFLTQKELYTRHRLVVKKQHYHRMKQLPLSLKILPLSLQPLTFCLFYNYMFKFELSFQANSITFGALIFESELSSLLLLSLQLPLQR